MVLDNGLVVWMDGWMDWRKGFVVEVSKMGNLRAGIFFERGKGKGKGKGEEVLGMGCDGKEDCEGWDGMGGL